MIDFVNDWSEKSELAPARFAAWLGIQRSQLTRWRHVDIAYINLAGTFYYLCSVLDGYSRDIVHWDIRKSMTERAVGCIL